MDANDICIFVNVVKHGDFSSTARFMSMSPSAISKAICRLENDLGRRLFQRSSRSIHLTDEGHEFLVAANRVVEALIDAQSIGSAEPTGTLRIRCLPTFAKYAIAPRIPAFMHDYPKIRLEFNLTNERTDRLDDGADIAIFSGELSNSSLVARRFATSRWIICASPSYLEARGVPQDHSELRQHSCLNFSMSTKWNQWSEDGPSGRNIGTGSRIVANQGDMLLALARAGAGIVRLAEFHVFEDLRSGALVPILEDERNLVEPIYAIYQDRRNLSPRIRVFIDFLAASFKEQYWV
ncbi:LysR family transcriptional regulator [Rhizobium leguminosarum]|uniref:LysR family transcriptional regulator n=1 Tax=Rhizobium ruizarguesonis TaxID=2081791 RepID=UPI0013BF997B|nr:LysR family transcriptional regulator [Rhizobium ruizarguesonis]NEI18931.1 LysR family transcriptional regulator [Rhizobium ruizarguesonis]